MGTALSAADYRVAKVEISATYRVESEACESMRRKAKDICMAAAKGRRAVSSAELEQQQSPSIKHRYAVNLIKAKTKYAVANAQCKNAADGDRITCRKNAKNTYIVEMADAKQAKLIPGKP